MSVFTLAIYLVSSRQQLQHIGKKLIGAHHYNKDGVEHNEEDQQDESSHTEALFKLVVAVFEVGKEFLISCELDQEYCLQSCGILGALQNTFFRSLKRYMELLLVVLVFVFFGCGVDGLSVGIDGIGGGLGGIGGGIGCGGGDPSIAMGGRYVGRY
ncbi:hypothetical protein T459_23020 [Capsicum annuum]|uniref:Uncharacterized protein n=1 Tax=Capsicum annuum TaxID=4072 RepID=A0A2G2YRD5_CAPAN|nr:hypothetical protein T459_23020 [Capsicum annuum]